MLAEDHAIFDVSVRPVWLVLVKVGSFVPDGAVHLNWRADTTLKNLLWNYPLHDKCITTMVPDVSETEAGGMQDVTRHGNTMEFNIWYVDICTSV
jgi:hypothetical protein